MKYYVNTRTKKEFKHILELMEEKGLRWWAGEKPTENVNNWDSHEKETCIDLHDEFQNSYIGHYKKHEPYYTELTYQEAINFLTDKPMSETITIKGKEYKLVPVEEEFMPKPEYEEEYYYINAKGNWESQDWRDDNTDISRYDNLNVYTIKEHCNAMAELQRHHKTMLRKYGVSDELYYYYIKSNKCTGNVCEVTNSNFEQIFSPLYISSKATDEEKSERARLINNLLPFLPINK